MVPSSNLSAHKQNNKLSCHRETREDLRYLQLSVRKKRTKKLVKLSLNRCARKAAVSNRTFVLWDEPIAREAQTLTCSLHIPPIKTSFYPVDFE